MDWSLSPQPSFSIYKFIFYFQIALVEASAISHKYNELKSIAAAVEVHPCQGYPNIHGFQEVAGEFVPFYDLLRSGLEFS
jgi:hypothetical protein